MTGEANEPGIQGEETASELGTEAAVPGYIHQYGFPSGIPIEP